ncbi:MAG: type II secretion system F family protein [Planctomycetota bacterium]|jgi:tight adherence protein C
MMTAEISTLEWVAFLSAWGCGAVSAYLFLLALIRARRAQLEARDEIIVTETRDAFMRAMLPTARRIGQGVRLVFERPADDPRGPGFYRVTHGRIQSRLASAGYPEGINADEYVGFNVIYCFLGLGIGVIGFMVMPKFGLFPWALGGVALGGIRMIGWLNGRRESRRVEILRSLPFSLDLLCLAMESGLDFTSALQRIVVKLGDTPLGEEFKVMLREVRLGKSRSESMRDLARRVNITEVVSVMASLVQAEEMGSNIGPVLRIQAEQQRVRRSQRAEEIAGKAPVKMLFPLVLVMLVTMMWLFAPIFIPMIEGM